MDLQDSNDEEKGFNFIQSLNLDYGDEKKEEEDNFAKKMSSLLNKLDVQLENVKKYTNLNMPIESLNIDISQYKMNFPNKLNNIINNKEDNLIEINYSNEINDKKEEDENGIKLKQNNINANINNINNSNNDKKEKEYNINNKGDYKVNEYSFSKNTKKEMEIQNEDDNKDLPITNISEIKGNIIKDSTNIYNEIQKRIMEEEEEKMKRNEEKEEEIKKKEKDLARREEELRLKEEEFLKNQKEQKLKEEEEKRKKDEERKSREEEEKKRVKEEEERKKREVEEEIKRKKEEEEEIRRKKEEEEEQNDIRLNEEFDRLEKEEQEKKEEEQRENERIKKDRLMKEKKEREEDERKRKEEEKKKELERIKKEEELKQENELKKQMKNNQNIEEDDEVKILEVEDEDIEELEEEISSKDPSNIKQTIIKSTIPKNNNANSNNKESKENNTKKESGNKTSINPHNSPENKNGKIKESNSTSINIKEKNKSPNKSINSNNRFNKKNDKQNKNKIKLSTSSNNALKKPKQQKEPEKDFQEDKDKELTHSVQFFLKSEVYKKLTKENRNKILEYINAVEDFDTKNPDLEGINSFPYINKFEKDEKSLTELIPNFEETIINKYDEEFLDNRVNKFLNNHHLFEDNKKGDKILTEILEIPNESHMEILKENFGKEKLKNLPKTSPDEGNNLEKLEKILFEGEEFFSEFNSPFSKLENLQTFIYKYSAHENPSLMAKAIKHFDNWRITLGDGNSFYRVVMFAIIENYIFESNSDLLSIVLNEMTSDKFIEIYKKKKLEYDKPFKILSAILMMIDNGMEEKAYEFFLKGYSMKSGCFDMLLILYLKRVLYNFGKEINKLLDEKKKASDDEDLIEDTKLNLDEIDCLFLEPKLNTFYLISSLFDININLIIAFGDFLNAKTNLKIIQSEDEDNPLPTCVFGFFFSSFHILYKPNIGNRIFRNALENDSPAIAQLTFVLKDIKKCDICFKDTKHLVFLRKKFIVCKPCLINYIEQKILKERKNNFSKEKCFGAEYYTRKIHLQDDFYLDDYEYIELFEDKNIINELCSITKCIACDKSAEISSLIKLKCGCTYCKECFDDIISQLTNNYGFLLECEYGKIKHKLQCACKNDYTYKDLAEFVERTDEKLEEAKKRMAQYIKTDCMICLRNLINEEKVKKIKMRKDDPMQTPDHFMCNNCYKKCFKENKMTTSDDEIEEENENEDQTREMAKEKEKEKENEEDKPKKKKKKIVKSEEEKIYCSICSTWHNYKGDGGSCACIIY